MNPLAAIFLGLGGLLLLAAFVRSIQNPHYAWILVSGMVFCAGLSPQVTPTGGTSNVTWATFLQEHRAALYISIASLLTLVMFIHIGKIRLNLPVQGALLMSIQLLNSLLRFNHDGTSEGIKSLVFTVVTMLPIITLLPLTLRDWEDWIVLIRLIAFAALVWALGVAVQAGIDHRQMQVNWAGRFTGLLGNPQGCGLYMAPMTFCLIWLTMNETNRKLWFLWVGTLSLMSVYSLWTGSRTCILVTGTGTLFVLYSRIGRFILLGPIIVAVLFGVYEAALAAGILSKDAVERLGSSQNTRAVSWAYLAEDALANPIFGSGFKETRANENSFLLAFAAYGVFCGVLVLVFLFVSIGQMVKLYRHRRFLPPKRRQIVDLILGFNAAYFAGAVFEWHIVSRLEGNIAYMLIFSVMSTQLMRKVDAEVSTQELYADELDEYTNAYGHEPDGHAGFEEPASA